MRASAADRFDEQLKRAQRDSEQSGASPVRVHPLEPHVPDVRQMPCRQVKTRETNGKVDEKRGTPAVMLAQEAAERRADGVREAKGARKENLPAQPHHRIGEKVRNRSKAGSDQHAAADPLQCATGDQHRHRLRQAAQRRRDGKEHDRDDDEGLSSEPVAEAAEDRHGNHRGQQVRRRDPFVEIEAPQVRHDGRQRRADHRLVDGDHHHDARQAQHREKRLPERPRALAGRSARDAGAARGVAHRGACCAPCSPARLRF